MRSGVDIELSATSEGFSFSMPPLDEKKTPSKGSTLSSSDVYVADGDFSDEAKETHNSDEEEEPEDVKSVSSTNVIANLQKRSVRSK